MEALALAGRGAARRLSAREEELLGLLAGFPDGGGGGYDRELSFSDLVEAGARPGADADADHAHAPREEDRPGAGVAAAAKQQRRQQAARQRARRSGGGSRGSCGGSGDGVLLNFYVPPGLLTRSMTAPRPGSGQGQGAPAKAAAGKPSRTQAPLGIGCWPALWGRGRDRRRPAKACS